MKIVVSKVRRYGLAAISCAFALVVALPLDAPSSCFFLAVIVSSLYGGKGPGLVAVGLSALAFEYFFIPPLYSFAIEPSSYLRFAVFLGAILLIAALVETKRRAEESRREINAQYRTIADTAPDAIISINSNAEIFFVNPAATKIFGRDISEMIGQPLRILLPMFQLGERPSGGELIGVRKDGTQFPAEIFFGTITFRTDSGGKQSSFTGFVRDISRRKRSEEALRTTQERLSKATQIATVGELAAAIAHEVNQPLSAIVSNGHACLRWLSASPPNMLKAHEAAERIIRDGKDAGEVVRRVRSLFKRTTVEMAGLDLNEVISEVLRLLRVDAARRNVILETGLDTNLPFVVGDRIQLQQVLLNLVLNGVEAMDSVIDRPRRLVIRSARNGAETALIEVRDHGTGLAHPDKAFEAFFTTKENGMGMGLAICRSIIEAHHGRIWVASCEGPGTIVCFTVPLQSSVVE